MSRGRVLPLLGPAVLLYLVVELITAAEHVDGLALVLLVLAGLSVLPLWPADGSDERDGATRVAFLGLVSGMLLVGLAAPEVLSLPLELVRACMPAWIGAIALSASLDLPDVPKDLAALRLLGPAAWVTALVTSVMGALVCLAPFELSGEIVVLPHGLLWAPRVAMLVMLAVAVLVRAARARLGSTPEALAASGSALFGTATGLVALVVALSLERAEAVPAGTFTARILVAAALSAIVVGHVAMLAARRPIGAARTARRVLSTGLALGVASFVVARASEELPADPVALGVLGAALALAAGILRLFFVALVDRTLAPDGGRLLRALADAQTRLRAARTDAEIGEAVLVPLTRSVRGEARPLLWLVHPDREVRVDAAGLAHVEPRVLSPVVVGRLTERPGDILLRAPLEAVVVRRPDLRPLAAVLEQVDALAIVALVVDQELEGALVVPRGKRRAGVTLEEIAALEQLALQLGALGSIVSAEARAQARAGQGEIVRARLESEIASLKDEVAGLRKDAHTLKAGKAFDRLEQPLVAYGPAMRAMVKRAVEIAPLDGPVLVRAERGTPLEPVARLLHEKSTRAGRPLVVADCLAIRPGRAFAALFGEDEDGEPHPGWLQLASGGSALLTDVPSLPLDAQCALAEALATKTGRGEGAGTPFTVDVRLFATSGVDLATLVAAGAFDAGLAERLGEHVLVVPGLAERTDDIASLVLLAIDRACRALGKSTVGIEDAALEALRGFTFAGGVRELGDIVERAVRRAEGPRLTLADLALDAPVEAASDEAWAGTWAEHETRMLEKALERAAGNKSEAARLLGLKRTTFLDKLKRAGLERPSLPPTRSAEP